MKGTNENASSGDDVRARPRRRRARGGFTLLEMSIVLVIIAAIAGGGLTVFSAWLQEKQRDVTIARLAAIRQALYEYRIAHGRIPCPADVRRDITDQYFGIEGRPWGDCHEGVPRTWMESTSNTDNATGNFTSGSAEVTGLSSLAGLAVGDPISGGWAPVGTYIVSIDSGTQITMSAPSNTTSSGMIITWQFVEGMAPTKTLGLPDDYAFDGRGRRIMYAVDVGLTKYNAFAAVPAADTSTRMTIKDASGNAKTTRAAYVLLSYGPNGHGAYPRNGDGWTQISSGSVNADEWTNCSCDSGGYTNNSRFTGTFVQKAPTQGPAMTDHTDDFDDVVVYGTRSDLRGPLE